MAERPDVDDWILRATGLALVRDSMDCSEDEASRYLTEHFCAQPSSGWRFALWYRVEPIPAKGSPLYQWYLDRGLVESSVQTWFWRFLRQYAVFVYLEGNSARYFGPAFAEMLSVASLNRPLVRTDKNVIFVDPASRIALHLSAIRLRARPLLAALRSHGAHVDAALTHLQEQGRWPANSSNPTNSRAPARHWIETTLARRPPAKGETTRDVAERLASAPKQIRTVQNWLSEHDDVWRDLGGDAVKPRR
jgi:hypothetical protein